MSATNVLPFSSGRPWRIPWRQIEDLALVAALGAMMALPLLEIVMRLTVHRGVPGSSALVQHLTLIVGMLGGALGARENRLLALSTLGNMLPGRWKTAAGAVAGAAAATVSAMLAVASMRLVEAERAAGSVVAWGLKVWWFQILLPLGFAAITLRIIGHSGGETDRDPVARWMSRFATVGLTALLLAVCGIFSESPSLVFFPCFLLLFVASVVGIPAFATLGGSALLLFWSARQPIASIPLDHYSLTVNPALPTLPLFTLAGYFLAEGGAPRRLLRLFTALFGRLPGGSAIVTALLCAFFTSFTGASGVTIIALGGLLMPILLAERYSEKAALGMVTGAGSLGMLFAPCLPLILYAIVARIEIRDMFLGGVGPGLLLVAATAAWGIYQQPKHVNGRPPFSIRESCAAAWDAKWELALPLVAFAALFSGIATPVEAAAITAIYAFGIETLVYRDIGWRDGIPRVMTECGLLVGGVLLVQGVALGLTNYLVDQEITARAVAWTTSTIHSKWLFLLVLDLFLLVVGCMMDIYAAIVIQTPLLVPIAAAYGLNPVHVGIVFLANLELGYLTPPVGLNLLLSSYRFNKPVPQVLRAVLPMVWVLFVGILLITFIPALTTTLPEWFAR